MSATATRRATQTGGRNATTRHIPPKLALAVGMPTTTPPENWSWSALTKLARMESGHTPSRRHPEYWDGTVPWVGTKDAKINHGQRIEDTQQETNELGLANSSTRLLPKNTVCLSRTASVGYVIVMGRPMATSQDFVNWVCSDDLDPEFLKYLLIAEGDDILRFASGSVHQTIYFPEVRAFHICHPEVPEQRRIVGILDAAFDGIATAQANAEKNLKNARALFESHLNAVFTQRRDGWVDKSLSDVVDADCSLSYGIVQPGDDQPDGLPIVRPTDLTRRIVTLDGLKRIDHKRADSYHRTRLRGGELLLCVRGSTGVIAVASPELTGANVTRGLVPIRFHSKTINRRFGYFALSAPPVQRQIRENTYGTALMQINIRDVRNIAVRFPPLSEQDSIATKLDAIRDETQRLGSLYQRKLAALDELKQSLLHQAFTGQLTMDK